MVVTDLGTAKHRGNNQGHSLEVSSLSSNPSETRHIAPLLQWRWIITAFCLNTLIEVMCQDHMPAAFLFITWATLDTARTKRLKERRGNVARCGINSSEVDTLSWTNRLEFVKVDTMRDWRRQQHRLGRLFILPVVWGRYQLERIMHLSKLSSVILKEDNKHLRRYASTKSTKMTVYNADRMFVT